MNTKEELKREAIFPKKKPSVFRKIRWRLESIWTTVENIPANIKMICQWIPILWNNWDWDYVFLLKILRYKLRRMSKHIGDHDTLVNSQKYAKQMSVCADLIDRILEDNYCKLEWETHEMKWGELQADIIKKPEHGPSIAGVLDMYRTEARIQGQEELEREESNKLRDLEEKRKQRDYRVLFNIMNKRIRSWWD